MSIAKRLPFALLFVPLLASCAKDSEITAVGGSIGQEIKRTSCPALGVPAQTGDVTLFDPPASRDSRSIDVVATLTELRGTCDDGSAEKHPSDSPTLATAATFRVDARRSNAAGPRDVVLPYYAVVMRGGTQVVSKSISQVSVHFDDGKLIASTIGKAGASVSRAEATLPDSIRQRIGKKRHAEDTDASVDPMNDPSVKAALAKASFELLVGFQLTDEQLAYNATR